VPAADAELALVEMLELFPDGVEEEVDGDHVVLSGFAETASAEGLECIPVADGWLDAWREYHHGVQCGALWVGPPWEQAVEPAVVIDPGRAFGTGAHGSTRAALALLQTLPPQAALDLGCGSGVLSIAAIRLGFGPIQAFDIDPLAVQASADNAARNGVWFEVGRSDALTDALPDAPLWIANLQLDLLERLLARTDLPPLLLVSGLIESQTLGGSPRTVVDGWVAEVLRP
jgi:ribosomal protein L11 methyltransferase